MELKSMVSSLEQLYFGLDPDDDTMCKQPVGLWEDLLYFMFTAKNMFEYILRYIRIGLLYLINVKPIIWLCYPTIVLA